MVGGTTPPQSDSGEISRVLVLNLLWQSKRCSRTAQDISVLTTPSLLSRGTRLSLSMTRQLKSFPRHPNSPADPPIRPLALNPVRAMDCRQEISAEIIRPYRRQRYLMKVFQKT